MFDIKEFIKTNLVNGVKNGAFAKEYAGILAVNYLSKGMLTETDVEEVATGMDALTAAPVEQTDNSSEPETDTGTEADQGEESAEEAEAPEGETGEGDTIPEETTV